MIFSRANPCLVALVIVASLVSAEADAQESRSALDCGPTALYNLARLVGHPLELDLIRSHLPAARSGNDSMEELSKAASAGGLGLRGVLLDGVKEGAIDRPMLVFLNQGEHGHFVVLRPLGESGKLVQVVDSINPPVVMDKSVLFAAKSWTGLALVLHDSHPWLKPIARMALATLAVGLILLAAARYRIPSKIKHSRSAKSHMSSYQG